MPRWMQDLFAGWPMIRANLQTFFVIVVLIFGAVWWLMDWRYGAIVASKIGQIELQDRQLADYKQKLDGASPDQAKAKIDALEEKVKYTIGNRWPVLTSEETTKLAAAISPLDKRPISILYANYLGKDLAQNIADVFKNAGWKIQNFSEGGGLGYNISTGRGNGLALTLKAAIEASTKFKVESFGPTEADSPYLVFVAVGIKPD
jgi:hypothetical protein